MTRDPFPPALRERLGRARPDVAHPGAFPTATLPPTDEAIAQFTVACQTVGGRVSHAASAADVVDVVVQYLEAPEWRDASEARGSFVAWDADHMPAPGIPALLEARGVDRLDAYVHIEQAARDADYARLDRAVVGVTGAHAALADTGTIALVHGAGRPRLVSLLPPVHVAVVSAGRLHATLGSWLRGEPRLLADAANVVLVTGPSRTADIEMTLTRGVHGPRIVHVVFVP